MGSPHRDLVFHPRQPVGIGHAVVVRASPLLIVTRANREPAQARLRTRIEQHERPLDRVKGVPEI